jgi:hypothetical protein
LSLRLIVRAAMNGKSGVVRTEMLSDPAKNRQIAAMSLRHLMPCLPLDLDLDQKCASSWMALPNSSTHEAGHIFHNR